MIMIKEGDDEQNNEWGGCVCLDLSRFSGYTSILFILYNISEYNENNLWKVIKEGKCILFLLISN